MQVTWLLCSLLLSYISTAFSKWGEAHEAHPKPPLPLKADPVAGLSIANVANQQSFLCAVLHGTDGEVQLVREVQYCPGPYSSYRHNKLFSFSDAGYLVDVILQGNNKQHISLVNSGIIPTTGRATEGIQLSSWTTELHSYKKGTLRTWVPCPSFFVSCFNNFLECIFPKLETRMVPSVSGVSKIALFPTTMIYDQSPF